MNIKDMEHICPSSQTLYEASRKSRNEDENSLNGYTNDFFIIPQLFIQK